MFLCDPFRVLRSGTRDEDVECGFGFEILDRGGERFALLREMGEGEQGGGACGDRLRRIRSECGESWDGFVRKAATDELALCLDAAAVAFAFTNFYQFCIGCFCEIRERLGSESFWFHLHDEADVWTFPVKGRALPRGEIDAAHGIHIRIGRTVEFDERLRLFGFHEGRAFRLQRVSP